MTITTPRLGRPGRLLTTLAVAAIALTTVTSSAHARGYERVQLVEGLFYGNFDEDVLLFMGSTAQDFCNDLEPVHDAREFHRADGSIELRVDRSAHPIYLYSSPLGAPELIDATCDAMFDEDPATVPIEPFAAGDGLVRMRIEIAPDGTVHVVNSTVGSASSADGSTWKVRGWADLMIVDGRPDGDPADFQGLRVARAGR